MRLAEDEARARLAAHDHGILCTVHAERGVDAVPVAYAVDERRLRGRARRPGEAEGVVAAAAGAEPGGGSAGHAAGRALGPPATGRGCGGCGPSCAGRATPTAGRAAALAARLAGRYPQYRDQPFDRVLVLRIVGVTGWAAGTS